MADDIKKSFEILGVRPDASAEEVKESFLRQMAVWNPKLFPGNPEKQAEAKRKQEEIRVAVAQIRTHPVFPEETRGNLYQQIFSAERRPRRRPKPLKTGEVAPSLLDETFSPGRPAASTPRKMPVWISLGGAILLVSGFLYLILPEADPDPLLSALAQGEVEEQVATGPGHPVETGADSVGGVPESAPSRPAVEAGRKEESAPAETDPAKEKIPAWAQVGSSQRDSKSKPTIPASAAKPAVSKAGRDEVESGSGPRPVLVRQQKDSSSPSLPASSVSPASQVQPSAAIPDAARESQPKSSPEPQSSPPTEPDPEALQAFLLLREKSEAARRLSEGRLDRYRFQSWRVVQRQGTRFWIDLLAIRSDNGLEQHLVWEVETEQESIAPLSQASRDLEGLVPPS